MKREGVLVSTTHGVYTILFDDYRKRVSVSKTLFLDTNIYIHYHLFDEIDWLSEATTNEVTIVVPFITVNELKKLIYAGSRQRIRQRASLVIRKMKAIFTSETSPRPQIREGVTIILEDKEPTIKLTDYKLRNDDQDDQLIASVISYKQENPGAEVFLITADDGLLLATRAKKLNINAMGLDEKYKLPEEPDQTQVENEKLRREINEIKTRVPNLKVTLKNGEKKATYLLKPPIILNQKTIEEKLSSIKLNYPKMMIKDEQYSNELLPSIEYEISRFMSPMPEEIAEYNKELDTFYQKYSVFILTENEYHNRLKRRLKLNMLVSNEGKVPAGDVDIFMRFPRDLTLLNENDCSTTIDPPEPPIIEQSNDLSSLLSFRKPYISDGIQFPLVNRALDNVSSFEINRDDAIVRFNIKKVKHGMSEISESLFVEFPSYESAKSFNIIYEIKADNITSMLSGELNIIIEKVA